MKLWHVVLLIAALTLLIYGVSLPYELLGLDDSIYYLQNPALQNGAPAGLLTLWHGTVLSDYSPVTQLTLWADLAIFGKESWWGARLHGLLWFDLGCVAVYALLLRLTSRRGLALSVALLYAAHPICAQGVLWLGERKHLVALALSLWSLERYVAARTAEHRRTALACGVTALALAVAALFAKPHAVALPVMLGAYELTLARGPAIRRLICLAPFFIIVIAFTAWNLSARRDLEREFLGGSRATALALDGPILLRYLAATVFPVNLTIYYCAAPDAFSPLHAALAWFTVFVIAIVSVLLTQPRRLALFGWLFALAGLSPALNLVPQLAPMADHYQQWALPGLLLAGCLGVERILELARLQQPAKVAIAGLSAAVLALAFVSVLRAPEFSSRKALYSAAVLKQPGCAFNWTNWAVALFLSPIPEDKKLVAPAAVRALECPDADRVLPQERMLIAVEAIVFLQKHSETARAETLLRRQSDLLGRVSPNSAQVMEANVALRTGRPHDAVQALAGVFRPDLMALALELRAKCRDGAVLPDHFPPLLALDAGGADEFDRTYGAALSLDSMGLLAEAYLRDSLPEQAFDVAAVLVNMSPGYTPGRELLA